MVYTYNIIDLDKYEKYDELRKGIFEFRAKNPENTSSRDNHNRFFAKRALWSEDLHLGEFLGGLIGKKNKFKICDTGLYRHPRYTADRGVISFAHLSDKDKLIDPRRIILEYLKTQNINHKYLNSIDVDTVFRAMFWFMYQYKRPYSEFINFKQDFIDMLVYDLKLLNPDRGFANWFIRQNTQTKETDLYPMFDNEMILGFNKPSYDNDLTEEDIKSENAERTSAILTPDTIMKQKDQVSYIELLKYLLWKYPEQTKKSLNKFKNFSPDELLVLLNQIPDLSDKRKNVVVRLYKTRSLDIDKIYEEYTLYEHSVEAPSLDP